MKSSAKSIVEATTLAASVLISTLLIAVPSFGSGPSISGGVSPAPRAVVIQGHPVATIRGKAKFDHAGHQKVYKLMSLHSAQNRILRKRQISYPTLTYICLEYKDYADFQNAGDEFRTLLKDHTRMEVVSNGDCK